MTIRCIPPSPFWSWPLFCSLPKQKINCALAKTRRNSPSNSPKWHTQTHMGSLPKLFRANCRLVWEADQSRSLAARDGTFLLQLPPPLWEEAAHIDFHRSWQGLSFVVACSVVLWLWRGGREVWRSICRDCHPFVRLDPTDYIIPRFGNRLLLNTAVIFYQDVNATNLRSLLSVSVYMSTMPFVV